jgi:ABC-type Mn2+/Zn2+ transport system permease subunit
MDGQFILSLITGVFIGGAAGYLGCLMLTKRMSLAAGPLGHLTLPGIALGLIYGFDVSLAAFPFVVLGIVLIWVFELRTKLPMEVLTAFVFAVGVAIAFLFLPIEQAEEVLVGDISRISFGEMMISVVFALLVFVLTQRIFPKMVLIGVSEDLAKVEGINVKKYNLIYLFCVALMVALGVKLMGGLLTAALVAIPAATSRVLSKTARTYGVSALLLGAGSALAGISLSSLAGLPAGPLTVLVSGSCFLTAAVFKRT